MKPKRDKSGRFTPKEGETLDKVISVRVTDQEFEIIKEAKKKGIDPREVLVEKAKQDKK